jgi:hypothetical protein
MAPSPAFGERRTYYDNFASHLLNAYHPNMLYPELPWRWSDEQWRRCIDMVCDFGFNVFSFWLEPRLFCREGLTDSYGAEFTRQIEHVIDHAHRRGMKTAMLCSLATTGSHWHTLCPNRREEWEEIHFLWRSWLERLRGIDIVSIFPGDPGACSLHGCTAETYIDRSCDIAALADRIASAETELGTWGPPFFGWGILEGPPGWKGEFVAEYQSTAWKFDRARSDRSMEHLLGKLPDFPPETSVAINLGFNPDGNPGEEDDAKRWIEAISATNRVYTWDFSLTEGENAITPHWRFERLFERRREERAVGALSGGICFTMTPLLNQLSLYESARSFTDPDTDPKAVAGEFLTSLFGPEATALVPLYPVFELVEDWGYYSGPRRPIAEVHRMASRFASILRDLAPETSTPFSFICDPEAYRETLLFYADLYAEASDQTPDYEALKQRFWDRTYAIYDRLPRHVDPRPHAATDRFIRMFSDRNGKA